MAVGEMAFTPVVKQPSYRRPLSEAQIETLLFIYKFRYISVTKLAEIEASYVSVVYSRYRILEAQGYIAKYYDKSYRLQGKPASYYLLPKALKLLKTAELEIDLDNNLLAHMARDNKRSQRFIDHHLSVLNIYAQLYRLYITSRNGGGILAKSETFPTDVFPKPRPDMYVYFNQSNRELYFMLEYFEADMPWFLVKQTIAKYMHHSQYGDWADTNTPYPPVLLISQSEQTQRRLIKHITGSLEQIWLDELHFALTTIDKLNNAKRKSDKIWLPVNDAVKQPTSLAGLWVSSFDE